MRRKVQFISTAIAVSLAGASAAFADILPGSFWPNGDLETPSLTQPSAPAGWRRGGGDFADPPNNTGPFTFDFWDNVGGAVSGTHALRINDQTLSNGEWFVPDFGSDASVVTLPSGGGDFLRIRFFRKYETSSLNGDAADMRLTIRGDDGIGSFGLGPNFDFVVNGSTGGQFEVADFVRPIPVGVTGIRINIASGGGGGVTGSLVIDDISVQRVPEPATATVLAGAAGMMLRRRNRK